DRQATSELLDALASWRSRLGFMLLAIDHHAEVLERICPRVAVIERGRIVQRGLWSEIRSQPATPRLARLL
ncbi:MAG: methionine ABC transporter ATP-binding protein, partial [Cyanobacteria bacterium REEB65]|nr:methionine ABC transporter ATP-binding protein [Cyanobacteria bacterium REEB65]